MKMKTEEIATKNKTIMIVEDDHHFQQLYAELLDGTGYKIIPVYDGDQALVALFEEKPDLIILDIALKMVNGDAFFMHIKRKTEYVDVPIIVISNVPSYYCKSMKIIDPCLVFLDKSLTKEELMEEISIKIG